jgi:hypothetical protein
MHLFGELKNFLSFQKTVTVVNKIWLCSQRTGAAVWYEIRDHHASSSPAQL